VKVTDQQENIANPDNVIREITQNLTMKVDYQLVESLRENAEIVDKRAKFY
jgi:peptidyl-prolyl cis-trans isomerase D